MEVSDIKRVTALQKMWDKWSQTVSNLLNWKFFVLAVEQIMNDALLVYLWL